jgi:uncharacterized protein
MKRDMDEWVWHQHWRDLLFLHWPVDLAVLRPHIPAPLEIDTHDGAAWVSLVIFRLRVRLRWLPFLPGISDLVEANLRTYVHWHGNPGIWFLSVHADNCLAIRLARLLTPMPYVHAVMRYQYNSRQGFQFEARHASTAGSLAALTFLPTGTEAKSKEHSLDEWLLERYRLFARGRRAALVQAEVAHPRWAAQSVALSVSSNDFGGEFGLDLSREPERAHFATGVKASFGAFRRRYKRSSDPFSSQAATGETQIESWKPWPSWAPGAECHQHQANVPHFAGQPYS